MNVDNEILLRELVSENSNVSSGHLGGGGETVQSRLPKVKTQPTAGCRLLQEARNLSEAFLHSA